MNTETVGERIERLERQGYLDPQCVVCRTVFYPVYRIGKTEVFAPGHKPSRNCESGQCPHCSCPICWG